MPKPISRDDIDAALSRVIERDRMTITHLKTKVSRLEKENKKLLGVIAQLKRKASRG
jgi:hypothetical protein